MNILVTIDLVVMGYFLVVNGVYAALLGGAAVQMWDLVPRARAQTWWRVLQSEVTPSVSLVAPAHNEEATIVASVQAMLALSYPRLEVVVVNDGSSDSSLDVLARTFDLGQLPPVYSRQLPSQPVRALYRSRTHPNLVVVDKENGGKADALNAGMSVATGELACAMDADTLVEADALARLVRPFVTGEGVVAVGGTIRLANHSVVRGGRVVQARVPRRPLPGFQVVEYLRAFLFGRLGWNALGGNLIISGAFGLFERQAVVAAGGYEADTVGEDMELVVRLRRQAVAQGQPGRVEFIPDPVAWTEAPESLRVLGRQRERWHRGLADSLWRHRRLMLNPRYGTLGLVCYPYFLFVELLGPVVEAVGLLTLALALILGVVDLGFALAFFLVAYGLGLCLNLVTLVMEELSYHRYDDLTGHRRLLVWALLENVGYRQLTVFWRLRGLGRFLTGRKDWGAMDRVGFTRPTDAEPQTSGR